MANIRKGGEISAKEPIIDGNGQATPYFIRYLLGSTEEAADDSSGAAIIEEPVPVAEVTVVEPEPLVGSINKKIYEKRAPFSKGWQARDLYYNLAFYRDSSADYYANPVTSPSVLYFFPIAIMDDYLVQNLALRTKDVIGVPDVVYRLGIYTAVSDSAAFGGVTGCKPGTLIQGSDAGEIGPLDVAYSWVEPAVPEAFLLNAGVYFLAFVKFAAGATDGRAYHLATSNSIMTRAARQVFENDKTAGSSNRLTCLTMPHLMGALPESGISAAQHNVNILVPVPGFKIIA